MILIIALVLIFALIIVFTSTFNNKKDTMDVEEFEQLDENNFYDDLERLEKHD